MILGALRCTRTSKLDVVAYLGSLANRRRHFLVLYTSRLLTVYCV